MTLWGSFKRFLLVSADSQSPSRPSRQPFTRRCTDSTRLRSAASRVSDRSRAHTAPGAWGPERVRVPAGPKLWVSS